MIPPISTSISLSKTQPALSTRFKLQHLPLFSETLPLSSHPMPRTGRIRTHTGHTTPEPNQNASNPARIDMTPLTLEERLSNFWRFQTCTFLPTPLFDLGAINNLGVGNDFTIMTQRAGISPMFWDTGCNFIVS
jgi:hypothetical protein